VIHDPMAVFQELFARARQAEPGDPTAMALATADAAGQPSVRMVLLKGADALGFVFYTNLGSRKARELAANPRAALCLHWPTLGSQVRAEGGVQPVSGPEADAYFASRPRGSQLGAWASRQSQAMASREELLARYAEVEQRFAGGEVARPPFWSGFRLIPAAVEIWQSDTFRLHHRHLYTRAADGWRMELLQP
jgi:pyridoxamine 5'-phosphate oxidase